MAVRGKKVTLGIAALVGAVALAGCRHAEPEARASAITTTSSGGGDVPLTEASATPKAPEPLRVEQVRVPGDLPAVVVNAASGEPPAIVFLPGMCSNVLGYVQAIQGTAHEHGGMVGLDGDAPCGGSKDFRSFSWDASKLHARIEAALAAAGRTTLPREGLVLVGYSQGAALGEKLVAQHPRRYARVVLIGAPTDPAAASFTKARAVVMMSCQRDVPWKMKSASQRVAAARVPSTYFEMPDCRHGMMNDAERVFDETFDWLDGHAKPVPEDAVDVTIGPRNGGG